MISQELTWQGLSPNLSSFQTSLVPSSALTPATFADTQPRLFDGIQHFVDEYAQTQFMFIKSDESAAYLNVFADVIKPLLLNTAIIEGDYHLIDDKNMFQWQEGQKSRFYTQAKIA